MGNEAEAETQYGDLTGTIAIDGHSGLSIDGLLVTADVPDGYHPVGLRIYGFGPSQNILSPRARVLCVDKSQAGENVDEIRKTGAADGKLITFEFDAELDVEALQSQIKRYDIVLTAKFTRGFRVEIQPVQD